MTMYAVFDPEFKEFGKVLEGYIIPQDTYLQIGTNII